MHYRALKNILVTVSDVQNLFYGRKDSGLSQSIVKISDGFMCEKWFSVELLIVASY